MESTLATQQSTELIGIHEKAVNDIKNVWRLPEGHVDKVKSTYAVMNSTHGLFSNVPIICKGEGCPYIGTCTVNILDLPTGYRCPIEIGAIMARFESYCQEFDVNERNSVDLGQIKQLVDLEVMIMRCDSKMAISADFIEETLKDVTKTGVPIYEKVVTQANQFKMTLIDKHGRILKDLAATRSSKKDNGGGDDASKAASVIMKRIHEVSSQLGLQTQDVLNADYYDSGTEDDGTVIDESDLYEASYEEPPYEEQEGE